MRIEIGSINVGGLDFGRRTERTDHTLVIDPDELRALVLDDPHFTDVRLRLARPGESSSRAQRGLRGLPGSTTAAAVRSRRTGCPARGPLATRPRIDTAA